MRKVIDPRRPLGSVPIEDIELDVKSRDDIPAILIGLQAIYKDEATRDVNAKVKFPSFCVFRVRSGSVAAGLLFGPASFFRRGRHDRSGLAALSASTDGGSTGIWRARPNPCIAGWARRSFGTPARTMSGRT